MRSLHHHLHLQSSFSISPLSLTALINANHKYSFSTTNKPKKSKIKIAQDEYTEFDEEANSEHIEEAEIKTETKTKSFRQNASATISNVKFSEDSSENKTYKGRLDKYIGINIGLDNILPRMLALNAKDPESITKTMNCLYIANALTGIPFLCLCWQFSQYIVCPELIISYFIMRYTANYFPGSHINTKLVEIYQAKYPLLAQCKWSRKIPDPSRQSVEAFADNLTNKISVLHKLQSFMDKDSFKVGKYLKGFRERVYLNPLKHGFAWDIADNTRVLIGLPLVCGLLHFGGVGLYFSDSELWNVLYAQYACMYIGGAYGARLTANWALRAMALTVIEKSYGLRAQNGEYFGYEGNSKMSQNEKASQTVTNAKVTSKRPSKKK